MRIIRNIVLLTLMVALFSGCALLEDVNNTIQYTTEATDLINDANRFAEQLPLLAERAAADIGSIDALKQELESMKERIVNFNGLVPPDFATDLHLQITEYNEIIRLEIDKYLQQINDNVIDLEALANAPILDTIGNLSRLLVEINQLGG